MRDEFGRLIVHGGPRTLAGAGGTLNLGDGSNATKLEGILHAIAFLGVTLLGMQEGSDRTKLLAWLLDVLRHPARAARRAAKRRRDRRAIRERLAVMGWRVYTPRIPGGKAVPIAYDSKTWQLLRTKSFVAVARSWVGAVGAGPTYAKPKAVGVAVFRHRETLEVVEHLNTHMLPSVERGKLPAREKAARHRHYRKHVEKLARAVRRAEKRDHGVLVTLDANAARLSPLLEPLRDADLVGYTVQDTHDNRGIDHVLTLSGGVLVGTPARVTFLRGFDHRLVTRGLYLKAAK